MAFNPLRAIGDLLNESIRVNQYGPNYRQKAAFLTRQAEQEQQSKDNALQAQDNSEIMQGWLRRKAAAEAMATGAQVQEPQMPPPMIADPSYHPQPTVKLPDFDAGMLGSPEDAAASRSMAEGLAMDKYQREGLAQQNADRLLAATQGQQAHNQGMLDVANRRADAAEAAAAVAATKKPRGQLAIVYDPDGSARIIDKAEEYAAGGGLGHVRTTPEPQKTKDDRQGAQALIRDVSALADLAEQHPESFGVRKDIQASIGTDPSPFWKAVSIVTGAPDSNTVQAQTLLARSMGERLHQLSGSAVSASEAARLGPQFPAVGQDPAIFAQKVRLWLRDLQDSMGRFSAGGVNYGTSQGTAGGSGGGMSATGVPGQHQIGEVRTGKSGRRGQWDGHGWVEIP